MGKPRSQIALLAGGSLCVAVLATMIALRSTDPEHPFATGHALPTDSEQGLGTRLDLGSDAGQRASPDSAAPSPEAWVTPETASIKVTVMDAVGRVLSDALVEAELSQAAQAARFSARTDSTGGAQLARLPPGEYRLEVRSERCTPRTLSHIHLEAGRIHDFVVKLVSSWSLSGTVRFNDGRPAAGARLLLGPSTRWKGGLDTVSWRLERLSAVDGSFVVDGLPEEDVQIEADSEGAFAWHTVEARATGAVDLVLEPGALLHGVLLDSDTRFPIQAASIRGPSEQTIAGRTDEEGRFSLRARSEQAGTWSFSSSTHVTTAAKLEVGHSAEVRALPRARVRGQALDPAGHPATGAELCVSSGDAASTSFSGRDEVVLVDVDGTVDTLIDLPAGRYSLTVRRRDLGTMTVEDVQLESSAVAERLVVRFPAEANVHGTVTDLQGQPVCGAHVRAWLLRDGVATGASTPAFESRSGADGSFAAWLGTLGIWRLEIEHATLGAFQVEVEVTDVRAPVRIAAALRRLVSCGGSVRDPSGGAVTGAWIWVSSGARLREFTTDAQGDFEFEALAGEPVFLQVHAAGYAPTALNADPSELQDIELVLQPASVVQGHVSDAQTLLPISAFEITPRSELESADAYSRALALQTFEVRSADGRFRLEGLVPGPWSIEIRATGYASRRVASWVTLDGSGESLAVLLEPSCRLHGIVRVQDTGQPTAGATVCLWALPNSTPSAAAEGSTRRVARQVARQVATATTSEDGSYELHGFGPGEYSLLLRQASFVEERRDVHIDGASPVRVDLNLLASVTLRGTIFEADGSPATDASVYIQGSTSTGSKSFLTTRTDTRGVYRFDGLEPGRTYLLGSNKRKGGDARRSAQREVLIERTETEANLVLQ